MFKDRFRAPVISFGCGFSVMVLELAGVRLLEPYLGSTIYVWGALIWIFMAALAIGYYAGGIAADHRPAYSLLGGVTICAGCWIFLMLPLSIRIVPFCLHHFSDPRLQATVASCVCFLPPCLLLGMATPYLLRLRTDDVRKIGGTAGGLYAVSTAGSIVGTFLVSFLLMQWLGTMKILWGTGIFLLFLGMLCLLPCEKGKFCVLVLLLLALGAGGFFLLRWAEKNRVQATIFPNLPPDSSLRRMENAVNCEIRESAYHLITICESRLNYDTGELVPPSCRARYMRFNEHNESGCLVRDGEVIQPIVTTCGYARLLKCGLCVLGKSPEKVLMIGAGGGVFSQMLTRDYPKIERIDVVDVDPVVFELAGKYFRYPWPDRKDSPVRSHVADGRGFLEGRADGEYDVLILDAFTAGGRIPKHLVTQEFFALAGRKLKTGGVLTMNLVGTLNSPDDEFVPAVLQTVRSVFRHVYVFPRNEDKNSNVIIAATNQRGEKRKKEELLETSAVLSGELDKKVLQTVIAQMPREGMTGREGVLLTDDFCPAESLRR